jgi:hypothetical protein
MHGFHNPHEERFSYSPGLPEILSTHRKYLFNINKNIRLSKNIFMNKDNTNRNMEPPEDRYVRNSTAAIYNPNYEFKFKTLPKSNFLLNFSPSIRIEKRIKEKTRCE